MPDDLTTRRVLAAWNAFDEGYGNGHQRSDCLDAALKAYDAMLAEATEDDVLEAALVAFNRGVADYLNASNFGDTRGLGDAASLAGLRTALPLLVARERAEATEEYEQTLATLRAEHARLKSELTRQSEAESWAQRWFDKMASVVNLPADCTPAKIYEELATLRAENDRQRSVLREIASKKSLSVPRIWQMAEEVLRGE